MCLPRFWSISHPTNCFAHTLTRLVYESSFETSRLSAVAVADALWSRRLLWQRFNNVAIAAYKFEFGAGRERFAAHGGSYASVVVVRASSRALDHAPNVGAASALLVSAFVRKPRRPIAPALLDYAA
jgi:hypothetical protein